MGTTLANLHIFNGSIDEVKKILSGCTVGCWSESAVSVFSVRLSPELVDKEARQISKKLGGTVLSAWIFDSDAVGISLFRDGKAVTSHVWGAIGSSKMGNITLFCETLGLPSDDVPRLRAVWKKGSAEEQLWLTGALLGLPLYNDEAAMPDGQCRRDEALVDKWISERPAPQRIRNSARAVLIQEVPQFRLHGTGNFRYDYYVSADPWDDAGSRERSHVWGAQPDGTVGELWSSEKHLMLYGAGDRLVCVDFLSKAVEFDSARLLAEGYHVNGWLYFLSDGRTLQAEYEGNIVSCCAPDGSELWRRELNSMRFFSENGQELLLEGQDSLLRISLENGQLIREHSRFLGINTYQKLWHNGAWWVTDDGIIPETGERRGFRLMKLDSELNVTAEASLPLYTQSMSFSPDGQLVYVFIYKEQVLALDAETLELRGTLRDKAYLSPLGFDGGLLWLQRDGSTAEAWDLGLSKTRSRHRLKGEIAGCHRSEDGRLCAATWDERRSIFRVYRLESGE